MTDEEAAAMAVASPLVHFTSLAKIADKDARLVTPVANEFQTSVATAYEWCVANGVTPKLLLIKARQVYGSTISGHLCYHHSRRFRVGGMLMADEDSRTTLIWEMLQRYADNDMLSGFWGSDWHANTERGWLRWKDREDEGNETQREVTWERETANDPKAGAAGTRHILWFSEAARYAHTGAAADTLVIGNAINSLPPQREDGPPTLIIMESSPDGALGYFVEQAGGAVTLEERMAGKVGNGWIKIFCGWHECADYVLRRTPAHESWFDDRDPRFARFKDREDAGRMQWHWTPEQIAWRRMKIISDLSGDERLFDRDYPDCEEVAFRASSQAVLDPVGLAAIDADSKNVEPEHGQLLQQTTQGLVWLPCTADRATHQVWEHPFEGARYIVAVDTKDDTPNEVTGETDCNAILVLRDACLDAHGTMHPVKVVARVSPENRMEPKPVAQLTALLSDYYGHAPIVVERNKGGAVIRHLRDDHHANLVKQVLFGKQAQTFAAANLGWLTDETSRRVMISDLQSYVREQKVVILCRHLYGELVTLGVNSKGKICAMGKNLDDDVMAISMGLTCLPFAQRLTKPKAKRPVAPDAKRWKPVSAWT